MNIEEKNKIIKIKNRSRGTVDYIIPDLNLTRSFQSGEEKEITKEELTKLAYIPGGQVLLNEYLIVLDKESQEEIVPDAEPEYFYTEEDIKKLLLEGSLDQLLDCLDFAPEGVIDLVKSLAVSLKIDNVSKRNAILEKTGFNVTRAIEINEESTEAITEEETKKRRVTASDSQISSNRRVIISQK
jgi:hypothetical protein